MRFCRNCGELLRGGSAACAACSAPAPAEPSPREVRGLVGRSGLANAGEARSVLPSDPETIASPWRGWLIHESHKPRRAHDRDAHGLPIGTRSQLDSPALDETDSAAAMATQPSPRSPK